MPLLLCHIRKHDNSIQPENLILQFSIHRSMRSDAKQLQCTTVCQNTTLISLLLFSVGHSMIEMTISLVPSNAVIGESKSTNWRTKMDSLSSICRLSPSTEVEAISDKDWNQQKLLVYTTLHSKHPFYSFSLTFTFLLSFRKKKKSLLYFFFFPFTFETNMKSSEVLNDTRKGGQEKNSHRSKCRLSA